eukprot:TRINITY_DN6803_c0_g1_i2.p2 TRINITY_DN6803_c0_g1~~TRINITY_DN6803_c0_g1_i2.p2  ORF type:complete len:164 (+),score=22.41 TRINITY_DN6803_c0_g1_i2:141-632(+)
MILEKGRQKMNDLLESKKKELNLDLTSLIDIIFLLLIFFMLTTTFDKLSGAKIDLPKSSMDEIQKEKKQILLVIDENNKLELKVIGHGSDKSISTSYDMLDGDLQNILKKLDIKAINILADKKVKYGLIISVIEKIKISGIQSVNLETKKQIVIYCLWGKQFI